MIEHKSEEEIKRLEYLKNRPLTQVYKPSINYPIKDAKIESGVLKTYYVPGKYIKIRRNE